MTSPYSRPLTDKRERTIRVLQLNPQSGKSGNSNTAVSGCLKETSLEDPVPYSALSYRWGKDEPHIPVKLGNGTVLVTTNGHAALLALRKKANGLHLWMDAICIDQSNTSEKEVQVAMMDKVYSKADKVIVWLGASNQATDEALDWCKDISRCGAGQPLFKMSARPNLLDKRTRRYAAIQAWEFIVSWLVRGSLQQKEAEFTTIRTSVQHLLARDWFGRMWTVQEVALSHEPVVMCGNKSIYWSHLVAGIQHAQRLHSSPETVNALHAVYCVQFFWMCLVKQILHESDKQFYRWFVWTAQSINALRWIQWIWAQALKATVAFIAVRRYFSGHYRLQNTDVDAWVLILLGISFIPIQLYFDPPMALVETRGDLLRDSLVVNINRVRRRQAKDMRDKVFALYGTLWQLGVELDLPKYRPDVGVAEVYHRFTVCFIKWHKKLDLLVEASWPPVDGAPTWVPDLRRSYERWDIREFKAAGESHPDYEFADDERSLYTKGLRLSTISITWVDDKNRDKRRFATTDGKHTGASPSPSRRVTLLS